MYCINCGAKNDDHMKFCTQCGTKLYQFSGDTSAATQDVEQMPKKRRSFKFVYILAAILILAAFTAMGKNGIYRTIAPKAYLGNALNKTFSQISDEISKSKKKLLGFTLSEKDDFTIDLSGVLDSISSDNEYMDLGFLKGSGINTTISIDKNNKQMLGIFQLLLKDDPMFSVNAFLNDEEIGVNVPELFDAYWTAKTANFGRDWNDSYFGSEMLCMNLPENLNISFSNIMDKSKRSITEETKKQMAEATKELLKNAKLGKMTSTNVTIKGKSVKAREIPVTISGSELKSYLIDMVELYFNDENVKNQISMAGYDFTDEIDEFLNDFDDYVGIRGDITIELVEYKGVIVKLEVEKEFEIYEETEIELALEISFGDNKALINDISVDFEIEVEGEKLVVQLTSEGNHIPRKGLFTDSTELTVKVPYEGKLVFKSECDIDLKNGTIDGFSEIKADKNGIKLDYSGEYSNSRGLKLSLSDVGITYKGYGDTSKISGSIDFSLEKGAKKDLITITEKQYILDMDFDEYIEYTEDENCEEKLYEIQEKFYELMYE
ncbi:MAG TPA: zinc ribbon domain-containing protein [Clostridiaceae bacterium]|nr:zinc ribbon domain-containing protein [Clostridiaceae bacterium]